MNPSPDSPELSAVVLQLSLEESASLPNTLGMAAHAWFLSYLGRHDPAIAAECHQPNRTRPFTVSDVCWVDGPGETAPAPQELRKRAEVLDRSAARLRITSLDDSITRILEYSADELPGVVLPPFDGVRLRVTAVVDRSEKDPDVGQASLRSLLASASKLDSTDQLAVQFRSPTVFKQKGRFVRTPTPALAFGSWLRRWNSLAAESQWPEDLVDAIAVQSQLVEQDLEIVPVAHRSHTSRGCVGRCVYRLPNDVDLRCAVLALSAFAFWAGTGKSTVWGLGQTRPATIEHFVDSPV